MTQRILVRWPQFMMIREVLKNRQIYFIAGTQSIYVPSRKEKYIISHNHQNQPIVREWPNLHGEMLWMSPGEAARTELEREFPNVTKIGWPKKSVTLLDWRWPMVFFGGFQGQAVYTDLVGAYHQIYRRLWLDCAFPRGRGRLSLTPVASRLAKWKLARNSVIGITRSRESAGYRGGIRYKLRMDNKFLSPHLWATVQAVLNEVAYRAVDTGAIYVNTDGYIHPVKSRVKSFQAWLYDCGLEHRTLEGDAEIRGWGNYKVGQRETKHYQAGREWYTAAFKSLSLCYPDYPTRLLEWWRTLE